MGWLSKRFGRAHRERDDGEYGGEVAGRLVWEAYEDALKVWEKSCPAPPPDQRKKTEEKEKARDASTASPYD
ncbi:hypothetical protein CC2G_008418 [Coprinopsis cinerea AmutBmut pab1-1]|nr:hypothetical protein CC2G_008418 [Coprinopsis cinerea AmutBmut pab1-1]